MLFLHINTPKDTVKEVKRTKVMINKFDQDIMMSEALDVPRGDMLFRNIGECIHIYKLNMYKSHSQNV